MKAPDIGSYVVVLEAPRQPALRDARVWTVWSQSPTGWWIFRKPAGGASNGTTSPLDFSRALRSER